MPTFNANFIFSSCSRPTHAFFSYLRVIYRHRAERREGCAMKIPTLIVSNNSHLVLQSLSNREPDLQEKKHNLELYAIINAAVISPFVIAPRAVLVQVDAL